jgi:Fe-S-cluster containining protein
MGAVVLPEDVPAIERELAEAGRDYKDFINFRDKGQVEVEGVLHTFPIASTKLNLHGHCVFYDEDMIENGGCMINDAKPTMCRAFLCDQTQEEQQNIIQAIILTIFAYWLTNNIDQLESQVLDKIAFAMDYARQKGSLNPENN